MKKLYLLTPAAILTGLLFLGNTTSNCTKASKQKTPTYTTAGGTPLPLNKIKLPTGFSISVYAEVPGARSMVVSAPGVLFVGTQRPGSVFAVQDTNGDHVADKKWTITTGMNKPNGVALKNANLYVAEISKVTRFDDIEQHLDNPGKGNVIYDQFRRIGRMAGSTLPLGQMGSFMYRWCAFQYRHAG